MAATPDATPYSFAKCPSCGEVFTLPSDGASVQCPHCRANHLRAHVPALRGVPAEVRLPTCPSCHAPALLGRAEGGMECAKCGTVFELEGGNPEAATAEHAAADAHEHSRRKNYTPDRGVRRLLRGGQAPEPASHSVLPPPRGGGTSSAPPPARPMPSLPPDAEPFVPSHVLSAQRHHRWLGFLGLLAVLAVIGGVGWFAFRARDNGTPPERPPEGDLLNLPAVDASGAEPISPDQIARARRFFLERIQPVQQWQDLLPFVRKRSEVEPLMHAHYRKQPFRGWGNARILRERTASNPSGRFVVFLLESPASGGNDLAMVELSDDGCLLDWELSVNYPLLQWDDFVKRRPTEATSLRALLARCYVRDELLQAEERPVRESLVGLRVLMVGREDPLFAALPGDSELGRWVIAHVPWEHEDKSMMLRVQLAFDPGQAATPERVRLVGVEGESWNR